MLSFEFLFSEQLFSGCFLSSCQLLASIARPAGFDWCFISNPPIASLMPSRCFHSLPVSDLPSEDSSPLRDHWIFRFFLRDYCEVIVRVSQPSQDDIGIATLLGEYAEKGPLPWITGVLEVKLEITAVENDTLRMLGFALLRESGSR